MKLLLTLLPIIAQPAFADWRDGLTTRESTNVEDRRGLGPDDVPRPLRSERIPMPPPPRDLRPILSYPGSKRV